MSADDLLSGAAKELLDAIERANQIFEVVDAAADAVLPEDLAEIVKNHSAGAAAAGVASGWVPGAGGVAAVAIAAGFGWTMYGRINAKIRLPFSENVIKSVASGDRDEPGVVCARRARGLDRVLVLGCSRPCSAADKTRRR